jgi:competence protein ComEC
MPLLIHAAGWWLVGLFTGASLGDVSRAAWLAPYVGVSAWPFVATLFALMVRVAPRARPVRDPRVRLCAALGGIALAGVLASAAAAGDARLCRAAAVERLARGDALTLVYDGALAEREATGAIGQRRPPRRPAAAPIARGRGTVRFTFGRRACIVASTVRLPAGTTHPLAAGDIALVSGRAMATDRGVRLGVDTVLVISGRDWLRAARGRAGHTIDRLFGERAPLVRALVIADQDGIATAVRDRFADAGLVHMLSVSGMHVAIIAWRR